MTLIPETYKMQTLQLANPVTLKNILLATDFSPTANNALLYAALLAEQNGSTLFAVHIIHPDVYPFQLGETWPQTAMAEEEVRNKAKRDIEKVLHGVPHEIIFERGPIWRTISSVIDRKEIDLLVIGTHGRTGISKMLMGSVAEQIFRQACCPVLTVGPAVCITPKTCPTLKRILYATDFSAESLAAAPFAVSLARQNDAILTLLHCSCKSEDKAALRDSLRDIVPMGASLTKSPTCIVVGGSPVQQILEIADEELVDLIVLGVRCANWRLKAETHFASSTTYQVATQATCPVLTVRA
jgi:nucleotide-binding universal stress UspA family protein